MANQPAPQPTPRNSRPYKIRSYEKTHLSNEQKALVGWVILGIILPIYIGIIVNYDKDQVFNGK